MAFFPVLLLLAAVLPPSLMGDTSENENLSTSRKEIQEEIVNKHNELRRAVSPRASDMLKMKWNSTAAVNAQKWANNCDYSHSPQAFRRIDISCGENLFMSSYPSTWSQVIQRWFDEESEFEYNVGAKTPSAVVGHYTQVVWNTSSNVGCGFSHCPESSPLRFFYVCHYCPAGNNVRRIQIPYTEGKPCARCPDSCDDGLCTNSCEYENSYSNCDSLKNLLSCEYSLVKDSCLASCNCEGKLY